MPKSKANRDYKKEYQQRKEKEQEKEIVKLGYTPTLQDFERVINQRYGPDDGSKTPPGFQAKNKLFELMHDIKVDENTPKNDQKSWSATKR